MALFMTDGVLRPPNSAPLEFLPIFPAGSCHPLLDSQQRAYRCARFPCVRHEPCTCCGQQLGVILLTPTTNHRHPPVLFVDKHRVLGYRLPKEEHADPWSRPRQWRVAASQAAPLARNGEPHKEGLSCLLH